MMWYGNGGMLGMHFVWWIFWVVLILAFMSPPVRRQFGDGSGETPLEILKRRYAAGEITTEQFEERKARLT
jgi:putative membrane protein